MPLQESHFPLSQSLNGLDKCPLISVIVPIFKTQQYLEKCLNSITSQTLSDIEVICVDDCSPDDSAKIIEHLALTDHRIHLIRHKVNLGSGGARNTGIRAARANYIASVDSDDYIDPQFLECLYAPVLETNSTVDLVIAGFRRVDPSGSIISKFEPKSLDITNNNHSIDIFHLSNPGFCNKLWRRSLFADNNLWLPNHVYYEDLATTPRILTFCRCIRIIPDIHYNYLIRSDSTTHTISDKHLLDYIRVFSLLRDFLISQNLIDRYSQEFDAAVNSAFKFHANNSNNANIQETEKKLYLQQLLFLKLGFVDHADRVTQLSIQELVENISLPNKIKQS